MLMACATRATEPRRSAFGVLAEGQLPRLCTIARRMVRDDAEDAVQDTLLKAYRAFDRLEHAGAGPAWLTRILVNVCRDRRRARARAPEEVSLDAVDEFSLYRRIADEDPFPYSDSLHLDFLGPVRRRGREAGARSPARPLPGADAARVRRWLCHEGGRRDDRRAAGTVLARLHRGRKLFEREPWDYATTNGLLVEPVR